MNILFVAKSKFTSFGGIGRVTHILAKGFLEHNINVTYLALSQGKSHINEDVIQYFIPYKKFYSNRNIRYINKLIDNLKIDIIINQNALSRKIVKVLYKTKGRAKLISVHHGCIKAILDNYEFIVLNNYQNKKIKKFIDNSAILYLLRIISKLKFKINIIYTIRKSDTLVLLSEYFIEELKSYLKKFEVNKVKAINNPVTFEVKNISLQNIKENRLLYVGRINNKEKRVNLLLDIWKKIQNEFPDWSFDIVGDGPDLNELKRTSKIKQLERLYFHGFSDPKPFLEKAKILCFVSIIEGFGLVLLEAQVYEVVPICFYISGETEEIIENGNNGVIIKKFNLDMYIEELKKIMIDEERRKKMASEAKKSVGKFSKTRILNEWFDLFHQVNSTIK